MTASKLPLLLALFGLSGAAHAQKLNSVAPTHGTFTTVDANGNVVRATTDASAAATAEMAAYNARRQGGRDRGRERDRDRNDKVRYGGGYYIPPAPYYPYGAPVYNNYYYPALPSTTVIGTPKFSWERPTTITSIPLGGYYSGYPAPGYPAPGYPVPGYGYPAPAYGYPAYGQPAYGYPGVPYPAYGTTTTIYGAGTGTVYSQSQTGGYGVSVGNGGISVQLGNRQSSSSTTVTTR